MLRISAYAFFVSAMLLVTPAFAQDRGDDLAKKLSNPVANLISVPFQFNWDGKIGPRDKGSRFTLNIQPVVPFNLSADWNLISRTIVPIVSQNSIFPGAGSQSGTGDVLQSLFFSPAKPGASGLIWGLGPVFLLPTGSDRLLSGSQWGAGPTGVALIQTGPWTVGVLANHLWSIAETRNNARNVSATYANPFINYAAPDQWTFGVAADVTYDWISQQWTIPVQASVSKIVTIEKQPVSFSIAARYYTTSPQGAPKGFAGRASIVFLFPK
jgi:hypothetical protein